MQIGDVCVVEGVQTGTVRMLESFYPGEEISARLIQTPALGSLNYEKGTLEKLRRNGGLLVVLDTGTMMVDPIWRRNKSGRVELVVNRVVNRARRRLCCCCC